MAGFPQDFFQDMKFNCVAKNPEDGETLLLAWLLETSRKQWLKLSPQSDTIPLGNKADTW